MVPDLTLEVIYLNQSTDFKMEFELCGCCTVRFLSKSVSDKNAMLLALSKSVIRSRAIVVVGSFNPLDSDYIPKTISKAIGFTMRSVNKNEFGIESGVEFPLPDTAIPLITSNGILGGCVLEKNDQSIIMLTDDRTIRHIIVSELVCPYLKIFSKKKTTNPNKIEKVVRNEQVKSESLEPGSSNAAFEATVNGAVAGSVAASSAAAGSAIANSVASSSVILNSVAPDSVAPNLAAPNLNVPNSVLPDSVKPVNSKTAADKKHADSGFAEPALSQPKTDSAEEDKTDSIVNNTFAEEKAAESKRTKLFTADNTALNSKDLESGVQKPDNDAVVGKHFAGEDDLKSSETVKTRDVFKEKNRELEDEAEEKADADVNIKTGEKAEEKAEKKTEKKTEEKTEEQDKAKAAENLNNVESKNDKSENEGKCSEKIEGQPLTENNFANDFCVLEQPETFKSSKVSLNDFLTDIDDENIPKKNRKWLKIIIAFILVAAVLLASYFGYEYIYQPMQNESVYNNAKHLYGQSWEGLPDDIDYKFGKLYQINNDIIGWLSVPNTSLDVPVVTSANKFSSYYDSHLFEGSVNRFGTAYSKTNLKEDTFFRNLVVYGKAENSKYTFFELEKYLNIKQYKQRPVITFNTLFGAGKWKVFSVFKTPANRFSKYIRTYFFDDDDFSGYLNQLTSMSYIKTNIDVNAYDQLITLVAKRPEYNIVVVAREIREGESEFVDVNSCTEKTSNFDFKNNSSEAKEVIVAASSSVFSESSKSNQPVKEDKNMADGAASRFEQTPLPTSSTVKIKAGSISNIESSTANNTSSKTTSNSSKTSSNVSSGTNNVLNKLPTLKVTNSFNRQVVSGPANEIVAKIIEAEMGSGYHIEALKAQAVATYSFLLCRGADRGSAPEAPMKIAGARAIQAANEVAGIVAVYNGNIAQTYYYAISAGKTANCKDIWSASLPYLVSVDSSVDKNINGYLTVRKYSPSDIAKWAKEDKNLNYVDLTKITDKHSWFKCTYDSNGLYCKTVSIGGVTKKGTYLRDTFFNSSRVGTNTLRSSAYTITYNESEDKFIFTVKGYGHGVGMSQTGANVYAKNGSSYKSILEHYYRGITLGTYLK